MSALIEDVLDFTRCQLGWDVSIRLRRVVDIFGALEPVVQEVLLANPQANIVFHHTGAAALLCDPGRIKQLMSDLIANAVAHGLKGGPILIKGQGQPEHAAVNVHKCWTAYSRSAAWLTFRTLHSDKTRQPLRRIGTVHLLADR